ncbi:MAG: hypothetical protein PHG48_02235 [Eubacteriales bacterium]|nr:hypothetical protein [Eubacteriales bacterium]
MIFTFFTAPLAVYYGRRADNIRIFAAVKYATGVLTDSIYCNPDNYGILAGGLLIDRGNAAVIDREALLDKYAAVLAGNLEPEGELYERVCGDAFKVLIEGDRFYVAGSSEKWSIPWFFSTVVEGRLAHLFSGSRLAHIFDDLGNPVETDINALGLTTSSRDKIISEKISRVLRLQEGSSEISLDIMTKGEIGYLVVYPEIQVSAEIGRIWGQELFAAENLQIPKYRMCGIFLSMPESGLPVR